MDRVTTIIFDIGNVLMRFTWKAYADGLFGEEAAHRVTRAIWHCGWWNELDRGVLNVEQIIKGAQAEAPDLAAEIRAAFERSGEACFRHDYAIPWIESFKSRGFRTLYLSNYSQYLMDKRPDVLDFLPHLHGGVFSCRVRLVKPDPAIYARICDEYGLSARECLFIDDNPVNIALAKNFGLGTVRFENYAATAPQIEAFLAGRQ